MDAKSDIFVKMLKLMAAYISGFTVVGSVSSDAFRANFRVSGGNPFTAFTQISGEVSSTSSPCHPELGAHRGLSLSLSLSCVCVCKTSLMST